jgi:hypothetical protein
MLVEHTFVTTMDAPEAMTAASNFLQEFGFALDGERGFAIGGTWDALEMRRGTPKSRYRGAIHNWPQQVRLEWDRGRVDVAATARPPMRGRLDYSGANLRKKEAAVVQELLVSLARSLEFLLAARSPDQARAAYEPLDRQLAEKAARSRRRNRIVIAIAVIFVLLAIGFAVFTAVMSSPHRR